MKPLMLVTLALLTAVGCAEAPVAAKAPASIETVSFEQDVDPTFCQVIFTPDAANLEETTAHAARWAAATGCDIRVGEGGIPVLVVAEVLDAEGGKHKGGMFHDADGKGYIHVIATRRPVVLLHEMGHALNDHGGHVETDETAVMQKSGGGRNGKGLITAADLVFVCEYLNCQTFIAEV